METQQKTWLNLLGTDVIDCFVDRKEIVRWTGYDADAGVDRFRTVWTFPDHKMAVACFQVWKQQVEAHRKKVADEKMSSNLISRVVRL